MQSRRRQWRTLFAALALVLMAAAWAALAPPQFGGKSSFVIVSGNSMEPGMHLGDLAIVRAATDYQIGDVVTYRHPTIGPVIHRIVGRNGDRFIFKGDHNDWLDSYQPSRSDLIGKLWVYIPAVGKLVGQLRTPRTMALLIFVMGISFMATIINDQDRRRMRLQRYAEELRASSGSSQQRPGPRNTRRAARTQPPAAFNHSGGLEVLLVVFGLMAVVALLACLLTITQPLERVVTDDVAYTQTGAFEYSATAPAGVYDAGVLRTGDPVFRKLVSQVQVSFSYRATADQPHGLAGTYRLTAELGASDGWKRSIELQPATTFTGDSFTAYGRLDLAAVQALIDDQELRTGIERREYTLALAPQVALSGTLAGQDLRDTFAPQLVFRVDNLELQIKRDDTHADPLAPMQSGALKRQLTKPNTVGGLGISLGVLPARWLSLVSAVLSVAGGLVVGRKLALAKLIDEPARIKVQYGPMLVSVHDSELAIADRVVEVATFDDLVRLAERDERMILYERSGPVHHYVVQIAGVNYHYRSVQVGDVREIAAQEHVA